MKKFIVEIVLVFIVVISVDYMFGSYLDSKFSMEGDYTAMKACTNKSDIAMIGASEMLNNYETSIISRELGMTAYNYGCAGKNIYYFYALINLIINKAPHKPKYILMELSSIDFYDVPNYNMEVLKSLNSFYTSDDSVKSILNSQPWNVRLRLRLLKLYKHNTTIVRYLIKSHRDEITANHMGFIGLDNVHNEPIKKNEEQNITLSKLKLEYLNRIIQICKRNNIKLIFVNAPYFEICNKRQWLEILSNTASKENIPFFNYEKSPYNNLFYKHPEWYYNSVHFNKDGARAYTNLIISDLSKAIQGE